MYTSIYCFFSSAYGLILTQDLNFSDSIRLELLKKAEKELGVNNIKTQYKNEGKMGQQGLQLLTATRKIWKTG
jgi:hypothetical protein